MPSPLFSHPDLMQFAIDQYFDQMEEDNGRPTLSGLAYHLGYASTSSFHRYKTHDNQEFRYVHDRAMLRLSIRHEEKTEGLVWLKNRDAENWSDRVDLSVNAAPVDKVAAIAQVQALVEIAQKRKAAAAIEHQPDEEASWMD